MITLWRIAEFLFGLLLFAAWIWCMVDWVRGGCRIPRLVHYCALGCLIAGGIISVVLLRMGGFSFGVIFTCALLPTVLVYVLWLWCLGPWASERENENTNA